MGAMTAPATQLKDMMQESVLTPMSPNRRMLHDMLTSDAAMRFANFLEANDMSIPTRFASSFQQITRNLANQKMKKGMNIIDVIRQAGDEVYQSVPPELLHVARLVLLCGQHCSATDTITTLSKGIFDNAAQVERIVSMRACWLLETMEALTTGDVKVTSTSHHALISTFRKLQGQIVAADVMLPDKVQWIQFWSKLFSLSSHAAEIENNVKTMCDDISNGFGSPDPPPPGQRSVAPISPSALLGLFRRLTDD